MMMGGEGDILGRVTANELVDLHIDGLELDRRSRGVPAEDRLLGVDLLEHGKHGLVEVVVEKVDALVLVLLERHCAGQRKGWDSV